MTRDAFARAMKRALTNAGFVNVRMRYLPDPATGRCTGPQPSASAGTAPGSSSTTTARTPTRTRRRTRGRILRWIGTRGGGPNR